MKKLKLHLKDLKVESFETSTKILANGTVNGNLPPQDTDTGGGGGGGTYVGPSCSHTRCGTCWTNCGTCPSQFESCNGTCVSCYSDCLCWV